MLCSEFASAHLKRNSLHQKCKYLHLRLSFNNLNVCHYLKVTV